MPDFEVFVSHDTTDSTLALVLKDVLEGVFPSLDVYVAGEALRGGSLWPLDLRHHLSTAGVILALVSTQSEANLWVHFEAGAGFSDGRTIPVCAGVEKGSLNAPLSLLQARGLDAGDFTRLVQDVALRAGYRDPTSDKSVTDKISAGVQRVDQFLNERSSATGASTVPRRERLRLAGVSPLIVSFGEPEFAERIEQYVLVFVPVRIHNQSRQGFTLTGMQWFSDPAEVIGAAVSMHRESDGSPCFGFTTPKGTQVHSRRTESEAWQFPVDLPSGETLDVVAVSAIRPKLDAPAVVREIGFRLTLHILNHENRVLGEAETRIAIG